MLEKEHEIATLAARSAGGLLKKKFGNVQHIDKKGEIDLVTEADIAAEKIILKMLRDHFPKDNILAEEAGAQDLSSDRTWVVDPLDGTTNFAHGFPFFGVSIGLEIEKEMVLGIVYNPVMDEFFEARKGEGAFLNHKPIHVSNALSLKESLLVTGFPYDIGKRSNRIFERFRTMVLASQGVRRGGSAAIDMCYVASGRLDGFWEEDLKPWDTAAGAVIVLEAGGRLSNCDGQAFTPYRRSLVACAPMIYEEMVTALKD
ncbi:MAG: inositol monophosphatase [Deltaproteobacteria bacterium]|nr:inositol monophosphatase [Deltaproteobacteria bacterium]